MERDMTRGNPGKIILNFTIPIFIGNMFQQIYNMADTIIVGKFVGNSALAAGWILRYSDVFDSWIFNGIDGRIYGGNRAALWCRK